MSVKVLVLKGDGLNCENETSFAFRKHGADVTEIHINDLLLKPETLKRYDIFSIPGGFSFGDDLGAARVLSLKLKRGIREELLRFVDSKKPILGICNGAQVLVDLGLVPLGEFCPVASIAENIPRGFINDWREMSVNSSLCKWIPHDLKKISMPIRHGEGRFIFENPEVLQRLIENNQVVLRYDVTPNGSTYDIAGLCDPSGLIFALMPHPEAAVDLDTLPEGVVNSDTNKIFKSIIDYVNKGITHA